MAKRKIALKPLLKICLKYNVPVGILKQVVRRGRGAFILADQDPDRLQHQVGVARARVFASGRGGARKARCRSLEEGYSKKEKVMRKKLSPKQKKIARAAKPKNRITGADF